MNEEAELEKEHHDWIGDGPCVFESTKACERAYRAYLAKKRK